MNFSKITNIVASGVSGITLRSLAAQQSNFEDVDNNLDTNQTLVVIFIILLILILFAVATYKLTGSALQTMLCILFGVFYIVIAYLYYAFAGYKLTKSK